MKSEARTLKYYVNIGLYWGVFYSVDDTTLGILLNWMGVKGSDQSGGESGVELRSTCSGVMALGIL
jgi:hypothetical protein